MRTPPPPPHPSYGQPAPPARTGRRTGLLIAVIALVVALAAAGTVAVVQSSRLADQRERVLAAEADAQAAREEVARLEAALEQAQQEAGGAGPQDGDPLADLFGEGGLGALEDLFGEGGLGGLGELEELFGAAADGPDVTGCTTAVADLPDVTGTTLQAQFDQATDAVEALREQDFPDPIEPEILTGAEIRAFFEEEIAEAYPADQADAERRTLGLLQAVPDDIDLVATQTELLGDQVAGFYDDEARRLVVRADDPDEPLGATGLITLAHELEHALLDATVGLPPLDGYGTDDDAAIAALAVVEGSAVALQSQFQVAAMDPLALLGDLGAALGADQGLDEVPALIRESLLFPYLVGPGYVCALYAQGGWDAVDAVVADPPATTHQVLFGPDGVAEPVAVPQPAGPADFDLVERRTFGAAQLSWLLGAPGGDEALGPEDPVELVRPWRGGEVSLWAQGEDSALALVLSGAGLCDPVTAWWQAAADGEAGQPMGGEAASGGTLDGSWGVVRCEGDDVRVGIGPDPATARAAIS